METNKVDISIIILNYNTPEVTLKCIKSFLNQEKVTYEILLVENSDNKILKQRMKCLLEEHGIFGKSELIYIDPGYNTGFAGGNNIGWEKSKGKYILLQNSDTTINNNNKYFLYELKKELEKLQKSFSSSVVAVSPIIKGGDGYKKYRRDGYNLFYNFLHGVVALKKEINREKDIYGNVKGVHFASVLIDKDKVRFLKEKFGLKVPFDEKFFIYFEDTYLITIWLLYGYKFYTLTSRPDLIVNHLGSYSSNKAKGLKVYHGEKNRIMVILLFYSLISLLFIIPITVLSCIARLVIERKNRKYLLNSYKWIFKNVGYILKQRKIIQKNRILLDEIFYKIYVPDMFHQYSKFSVLNYIFKVWFFIPKYLDLLSVKLKKSKNL